MEDTVKTMNELGANFDLKLDQFKKELQNDQEQVAEKMAKRAKLDKPAQQFKSKGNEDQFHFNAKLSDVFQEVGEKLTKMEKLVQEMPSTLTSCPELTVPLEQAKEAIVEGERLVATYDLKSGYHHESSQNFLGNGKYFVFTQCCHLACYLHAIYLQSSSDH